MLVVLFVFVSELLASAVIAGIVALLAIASAGGVVIYVQGEGSAAVTNDVDDEQSVPAD